MRLLRRRIPEVQRIRIVDLGPDDMVVIEAAMTLTAERASQISEVVQKALPGRSVLVLADGLTLSVVRHAASAPPKAGGYSSSTRPSSALTQPPLNAAPEARSSA